MLAKSEHDTDGEFYFHLRAKTMVSPELERFFLMVAGSKDLQQQLKRTKEVADAAQLARDLGFQITDAEVMLAQANRILSMPIRDQDQQRWVISLNSVRNGAGADRATSMPQGTG